MSLSFDPGAGLIVVPTKVRGPIGDVIVQLALDTGATGSVVNSGIVLALGYDLTLSEARVRIITGSGIESAPRIVIEAVEALGQTRQNFPMLCHTLPPSATVDGVLGLDFLRNQRLVLDFRAGLISLE